MAKSLKQLKFKNHCIASTIVIIGSGKKNNGCGNREQDNHCVKVSL